MKILWVKAGGLVPPDTGGKIRSYNILRELAREHAITFFSFYEAHTGDIHSELENVFEKVICVPLNLPRPKSFRESLDYATNLLTSQPYNISKYCRPPVREELRRLLQREKFDVLICDFLIAAGAVPWDFPVPKVLFTHNVESAIWRRHYQVASNPVWKALSWREWRAMERAECRYVRRADHVLTVSEDDHNFFAKYTEATKLDVIPTGADTEYFQPMGTPEVPDSLVFTGSLDWLPNEDAILFFIKEILPLLRGQVPDVSLTVVGRKPSKRLTELANREPGVKITGRVEDVRPFLGAAAVCIVPLRIGGGTRLKIFEAMSMGKAVVSTSVGAEGLPVNHEEHLIIADDPAAFASNTVRLLRDHARRHDLGVAARKLVEENYSWTQVANRFAQVLIKVIGESRA